MPPQPSWVMANKTKPRILPWLREQLDSGLLGATWIDAEHKRFSIPWKHGLRQDLQQEDFRIFQAWAEASGSYRPGIDVPDPAAWKRNFRAALDRKQNLRMVSNHSRDTQNPHKIYEFLPEDGEGCDTGRAAEHGDQEETIQEILEALTLSTQQQQFQGDFNPNSLLEQLPQTPEPALSCNPLMPIFASGFQTEYEVTAFYRGRQVLQKCLSCLKGLRLVGPGPGAETWMELDGTSLALPEPSSTLTDQRTAYYVSRVLGSLGAGLALWNSQTEFRAQRLGHCGAYWSLGEQASPGATGREVTKEKDGQQVCYIPEFVNDLISFLEGSHRSPQYTLWFCLGESWPTNSQLWTKKLVIVKVVPTALRALHEVAQAGGASSLEEEVDLHISDSVSLSLAPAHLHGYLQGLAQSMQWESGAHC
ncbi:interferon regulatory factor 3 isoform X1 [Phascolarctos cinereus]|uniref:Interferon regulatory factor 3 isoform X1 n=2 Tax=Phascolarctos cinereus TaxID=38626 RepID=A0A6P5LSM1_PHACI|nr:interferon regulatory factor 3 isoform X1 [Phascolarctos cinereus]